MSVNRVKNLRMALAALWDESLHPRDKDGKFGSGGARGGYVEHKHERIVKSDVQRDQQLRLYTPDPFASIHTKEERLAAVSEKGKFFITAGIAKDENDLKKLDSVAFSVMNQWEGDSQSNNGTALSGVVRDLIVNGKDSTDPIFVPERFTTAGYPLTRDDINEMAPDWVRTEYDHTQTAMRNAGVEEVHLYRGAFIAGNASWSAWYGTDVVRAVLQAKADGKDEVSIPMRTITSWSEDHDVAERFARSAGDGGLGILVHATVPTENIFTNYHTEEQLFKNSNEAEHIVIAPQRGMTIKVADIEFHMSDIREPSGYKTVSPEEFRNELANHMPSGTF